MSLNNNIIIFSSAVTVSNESETSRHCTSYHSDIDFTDCNLHSVRHSQLSSRLHRTCRLGRLIYTADGQLPRVPYRVRRDDVPAARQFLGQFHPLLGHQCRVPACYTRHGDMPRRVVEWCSRRTWRTRVDDDAPVYDVVKS